VRHFFITSLKDVLFLSSNLGFYVIRISSLIYVDIASLIKFLENLTFFSDSTLSIFNSIKQKKFACRLAIVTSMSCALVINSWKVLGLLIYRTFSKSHSLPWVHISKTELSDAQYLHSRLNVPHQLM